MKDKIRIHKIQNINSVTLDNNVTKEKYVFLPDPFAIAKINEIIATVNALTMVVADLIKETGSKKYKVDDIFEMETDENGHDLQCSSGVGARCDCWKKEETPEWLEYHCPKCGCIYDDKGKGLQGRNQSCECDCKHQSPCKHPDEDIERNVLPGKPMYCRACGQDL